MHLQQLLFILFFISFQLHAQTQDGILKNGRSVTYHTQKSQLLRALEEEENEYAQISYAKVINSFGTVKIDGFSRTGRHSILAEDLQRSKTEDVQNLPIYLPATLSYTSTAGTEEIYIQIYINPKPTTINSSSNIQKVENDFFSDTWQTENYSTTTTSGIKYQGPATFFLLGDYIVTNTSQQLQIKGKNSNHHFTQIEYLVVCILAIDDKAQEILATINHERLNIALDYDENWP